jgi:peptidoglycan hydrolase-like protein with peptidoglycan-binding domain
MTESSAAAIPTVQVSLTLPHLLPGSNPPPNKEATARVQHILNDIAKAHNKPRIFGESGAFGDKTIEQIKKFQHEHGISPASAKVGPKTWKALLETWIALRPPPVPSDDD